MVSQTDSCRVDLAYTLGRDDRIEQLCPYWARAAHDRMGMRLDQDCVLGQPLWAFINGGATLRLYHALIWHVRNTGRRISFRYRGDCPGATRYMRMTLTPGPKRRVHLRSELLYDQPTPHAVFLVHVDYRRNPQLTQCSLCHKIEAEGRWFTLSEILEHTTLIDALLPTQIGDTVCDSCRTKLELELRVLL